MKSVNQFLTDLLERAGFTRGSDLVLRRWNSTGDICCAIALKVFSGEEVATVEIGFVCPQILSWFEFPVVELPLPTHGNGFGIFYRLSELGIQEGFVSPPGGWRIASDEEAELFRQMLERELLQRLTPLLNNLMTLNGWVDFFKQETRRYPCGRGRAWALLGYSLLANSDRSIEEIQAVIDEHAIQNGSKKIGNRLDSAIAKQRELLLARTPAGTAEKKGSA